jgi:hypothetical protein
MIGPGKIYGRGVHNGSLLAPLIPQHQSETAAKGGLATLVLVAL